MSHDWTKRQANSAKSLTRLLFFIAIEIEIEMILTNSKANNDLTLILSFDINKASESILTIVFDHGRGKRGNLSTKPFNFIDE